MRRLARFFATINLRVAMGGNWMQLDRETLAAAFVGTGGAWMLGSTFLHRKSGRWGSNELHGLFYSGIGFLTSAGSARWLEHTGRPGMAVSLMGTVIAMRGIFLLLRERAAKREREKSHRRE